MNCEHRTFLINANINRLLAKEDEEPPVRYVAEIRITCEDCGKPMRFVGLPIGMDMTGASVSPDGQEGRFSIYPVGESLPSDEDAPPGFRIHSDY